MPWGIELHVLLVNILFITALNIGVLYNTFVQEELSTLGTFTALPWVLVPIMAIHPNPSYTILYGATVAAAWDIFLLWPTYLTLTIYGLYLFFGRVKTVANRQLSTINA